MSPATRRIVLAIVMQQADASVVDRVLAKIKETKDPLEKETLLGLLIQVEDAALAERVLNFAIGPEGVAGSAPEMFWSLSHQHPDLAWNHALQYLNRLNASLDPQMQLMLIPAIAANSMDPKRMGELKAYADQHIPPSARQYVESAMASIQLNANFRSERLPKIDRWLSTRAK
jgi:aminopeptidase N